MQHYLDIPSPLALAIAGGLSAVALTLLLLRARRLGRVAISLLALALVFWTLAAGGIRIAVSSGEAIPVLLDMSASTRSAEYRDDGAIRRRLEQLLGRHAVQVHPFTDAMPQLDRPALLFSDGRMPLGANNAPAAIFPVLDDRLARAADARISEIAHERGRAIARIHNSGAPRQLQLPGRRVAITTGDYQIVLGPADQPYDLHLIGADDWPENDRLSAPPEVPSEVQRWTLGVDNPPSSDFRALLPSELPSDTSGLASTSILILNASLADALSTQQQSAIETWVRHLGGTLVIIGDSAQWTNLRRSSLEAISPLSPDPPEAQREWVILIDASGSMAQRQDTRTNFQLALSAAQEIVARLPRHDLLQVSAFAGDLLPLYVGPVAQFELKLPERFSPRGPTNLQAALRRVLDLPRTAERQVIILSDAEVELPSLPETITVARQQQTAFSVLALTDGRGREALRQLASDTGGAFAMEILPQQWAFQAADLAGKLAPSRWNSGEISFRADSPSAAASLTVRGWNSAFPRPTATIFAKGDRAETLAAMWPIGLGKVATIAFALPPSAMARLAAHLEQPPLDPRFSCEWDGNRVRVQSQVPDREITLRSEATTQPVALTRSAPGLFEGEISLLPDRPADVAIVADGQIIARRVFPARYSREFYAIGADVPALEQLAQRSGGRLIRSDERTPISELARNELRSCTALFGAIGLVCAAISVLIIRREI